MSIRKKKSFGRQVVKTAGNSIIKHVVGRAISTVFVGPAIVTWAAGEIITAGIKKLFR